MQFSEDDLIVILEDQSEKTDDELSTFNEENLLDKEQDGFSFDKEDTFDGENFDQTKVDGGEDFSETKFDLDDAKLDDGDINLNDETE